MKQKFYHFHDWPNLPESYIHESLNGEYTYSSVPTNYSLTPELFKNSKLRLLLRKKFGQVGCSYLKFPPMSIYNWHTDRFRNSSLNWVIQSGSGSITIYKKDETDNLFSDFEVVDYVPLKPTLINTSIKHCVINNSPIPRIILSVDISNDYSYEEMKDFLINIQKNDLL